MNERSSQFDRLIERARREQPPVADVAARVRDSLRRSPVRPTVDWPLMIATAMSVAAALLVMAAAGYQHTVLTDPIAELFLPLTATIQ